MEALSREETRELSHSPMKMKDKRISTYFEYLMIRGPNFRKQRYSRTTIRAIEIRKGREMRKAICESRLRFGSVNTMIVREISWEMAIKMTQRRAVRRALKCSRLAW